MRRIPILCAALALVVLVASDSLAARFTAFLDPLEAALQARVDDAGTDAKLRKLYAKHLKKLAKPTATLAQDVKTAASIVPALEKKAAADTALLAAAEDAVEGLANSVGAYLATVEVRADGLRAKKDPLVKIDSLLTNARTLFGTATAPGTLLSRIRALLAALVTGTRANNAVTRAINSGGGGGGGGGGGACGPSPKPAGLRNLGSGESFTAHVVDFDRTYDFAGSTVTARVTPSMSAPGNPNVLEITAYDCTKSSAAGFTIPYPPVVDQTYVNGFGQNPAVGALYRYDWDGLTEVFPGGVTLKATAFDQQAKTVTIEFSVGVKIVGTTTIRGW